MAEDNSPVQFTMPLMNQEEEDPIKFTMPGAEEEEKLEDLGDYGREFLEGVGSGVIKGMTGIAELGTSLVDLAAGTDYTRSVTEASEKLRDSLGLDPQGLIGQGTEAVFQFVLPGLGAANMVSKGYKASTYLSNLYTGMKPATKVARALVGKTGPYRGTGVGRLERALSEAAKKSPETKRKLQRRLGRDENLKGLTKSEAFSLGAQQVAAAAAVDIAVANDGTTTIGDFFGGGPTMTEADIGASGRENAMRVLTNKFKAGIEAGAATVVAPTAVNVLGKTTSKVLTETPVVSDAIRLAAVGANKGLAKVAEASAKAELNYLRGEGNTLSDAFAQGLSMFRYRSFLPQEVATAKSLVQGEIEGTISAAKALGEKLDKTMDEVVKESARTPGTTLQKQQLYNHLNDFLTHSEEAGRLRAFNELPTNVQKIAKQMRGSITQLSNEIKNSKYLERLDAVRDPKNPSVSLGEQTRQVIERNVDTYFRRRYRMFEMKNFVPTDEIKVQAKEGFRQDDDRLAYELGKVLERDIENGTDLYSEAALGIQKGEKGKWEMVGFDRTDEQLDLAVEGFLKRYKPGPSTTKRIDAVAINKINAKMFDERVNMPEYQRNLLGEITDVREAYLGTVADLSEFLATDRYFGYIDDLVKAKNADGSFANPGVRALFRDNLDESGIIKDGAPERFTKLDSEDWGALMGYSVNKKVYNDMTRLVVRDMGVFLNSARGLYSGFLRAKGATQYGKTVLSLPTQIRNVTSASLFAAMQGNVGRGASIAESFKIVWRPFADGTPDFQLREYQKMQRLGVFGNQAELKEIKENIAKGLGFSDEATVGGVPVGRKWADGYYDKTLGSFIGRAGNVAESFYQGGDDLWKYYNYKFERQKIVNALDTMSREDQIAFLTKGQGIPLNKTFDDMIDEYAADIVRNVVPNYNLAPDIIKGLRRLPIGNFIAFPYEIYRTTAHSLRQGLTELASDNAAVREIGLRRMSGVLTTTTLLPMIQSELAHQMTGVTKEETRKYQRSISPDWEKNSTLLPIGRTKDGIPNYINYSYTNPYDILSKATVAIMNEVETGGLLNKDPSEIVFKSIAASLGELTAPFTEDSIAASLIRDVAPESVPMLFGRGGERETGARIYNPEDDFDTKLKKSVYHVLGGMAPQFVPVDVRSGELEPGRFAQSVMNAFADNEDNQRDRYGRERELGQEFTRIITGLSQTEADVPMSLKYKGYEFGERLTNAGNIFTAVSNRQNATPEDFVRAYQASQEARYRIKNEMYLMIQDMKGLGLDEDDIEEVLKKANIGGIDDVLAGEYQPSKVSRDVKDRVDELGLELPEDAIEEIQDAFEDKPFGVPMESVPPVKFSMPQTQAPVEFTMPDTTPPSAPVSPPSPQGAAPAVGPTSSNTGLTAPPIAMPTPTQLDPSLLGSNPVTAMRNAQIAARRTTT